MKKFAAIFVVFFIPILLFGFIIEVLTRNIPNLYSYKSTYLETNSDTIETLILGNSHAYYGINPEFMDTNTYNAAFVSQTLDIDYKFLKHYQHKLKSLKVVILRLSYYSLFEQMGKTDEDWRITNYNLYTKVNLDTEIKHQFNIFSVKLDNNLSVINDYYIKGKDELNCNALGFGIIAKDNQYNLTLEEAGPIAAKRHTISDQSLMNENIAILNAILKFCETHDVKVVLFTPPAYKSYSENLNGKQLELTTKTGQDMEKKFPNVYYYNYLNNSEFEDSDFFDGDHLNENGARKFSQLLNSVIHKDLKL